jgi:hypothetical protein
LNRLDFVEKGESPTILCRGAGYFDGFIGQGWIEVDGKHYLPTPEGDTGDV